MQIALQDIRVLGYNKINKCYLDSHNRELFFDKLNSVNTLFNAMKIPAYSLLNKWSLLEDVKDSKEIEGYSIFIHYVEPMIDLDKPTSSSKRKCRNTWDSIWDNFGVVIGLEDYQISIVKEFGLKLLFLFALYNSPTEDLNKLCCSLIISESIYKLVEDLLEFYNIVLKWAIFTQQEENFNKNNLSFIDVLRILVVDDKEDFEMSLSRVY